MSEDLTPAELAEVTGKKRAAHLSASLADASKLLQHSSQSVTRQHYRKGDKIKQVR